MPIAIDLYTKRVSQYANRDYLQARDDEPLKDIVGRMSAGPHSAVTIVDPSGQPIGIITEHDIVHRVTFSGVTMDQPVRDVMTYPVATIAGDERLFQAITQMRRLRHRHLPVVDEAGGQIGMLDQHDTVARAAEHIMTLIDLFSHGGDIDGQREVKASQADIAGQLLHEGVSPGEVQSVLTVINKDIYRHAIDMGIEKMAADGLPPPPVEFCLIIAGSGGRGENNLFPDQDYGFILADYPDDAHNEIDPWFITLAEHVSDSLNLVGLPYCKGHVMATNPLWRKTSSQWIGQLDYWNRNSHRTQLVTFDIFFDFDYAWGERSLARDLREYATNLTKGNTPLLLALFAADRDHGSALRWFGRFIVETEDAEHRNEINLKKYGLLPLIESVRMLALREGVSETGTRARLAALRARGAVNENEFESLNNAHEQLSLLILNNQVEAIEAGRSPSSFIAPGSMTRLQKKRLRESFKTIDNLRSRIEVEFGGEIF